MTPADDPEWQRGTCTRCGKLDDRLLDGTCERCEAAAEFGADADDDLWDDEACTTCGCVPCDPKCPAFIQSEFERIADYGR